MADLRVELRGRKTWISVTQEEDPTTLEIGLTIEEVYALVDALARIQQAIKTMDRDKEIKAGHIRLFDKQGNPVKES